MYSVIYADDKKAYVQVPVSELQSERNTVQDCIADVGHWCASRRLQLDAAKT
jgi:predicted transport protein